MSSDIHYASKIILMKVKLEKDHVLGAKGESVEVAEGMANYLNRMGVIHLTKKATEKVETALAPIEVKEEKATVSTKEEKTTRKTKGENY